MVPLNTVQGLDPDTLRSIIGNRRAYVWGCNRIGIEVLSSLEKHGATLGGFADTRSELIGTRYFNKPVVSTRQILDDINANFIVVATPSFQQQAIQACEMAGRNKDVDFIKHTDVRRPAAVIDVAGHCNLSCTPCPRNNDPTLATLNPMSFASFEQILNKLLIEQPLLSFIELFGWSEPLLNGDLPRIIRLTEQSVPCAITTNLTLREPLNDMVAAEPTQLIVKIIGVESNYEKVMGSSWQHLQENLQLLSKLAQSVNTELCIHLYRTSSDIAERFSNTRARYESMGFRVSTPHLYPGAYDGLLDYCEGKAELKNTGIPWNIPAALDLVTEESDKPCLCQRIFPVINSDQSVSLCHTYHRPIVASDFMATSLSELVEKRHQHEHCRRCQTHGLHRLDLDVLAQQQPTRAKQIIWSEPA